MTHEVKKEGKIGVSTLMPVAVELLTFHFFLKGCCIVASKVFHFSPAVMTITVSVIAVKTTLGVHMIKPTLSEVLSQTPLANVIAT